MDRNRERARPGYVPPLRTHIPNVLKSVLKPTTQISEDFEHKGCNGKEKTGYKLENNVESEESREVDSKL